MGLFYHKQSKSWITFNIWKEGSDKPVFNKNKIH